MKRKFFNCFFISICPHSLLRLSSHSFDNKIDPPQAKRKNPQLRLEGNPPNNKSIKCFQVPNPNLAFLDRKAIFLVRDLEHPDLRPTWLKRQGEWGSWPMSSEQRIRGNPNPGKHVSHQSQRQIKKIDIFFRDASGTGFDSGVLNSEKRGLTQPDTGLGRSINESVQYYWKNELMSNALSRSKLTASLSRYLQSTGWERERKPIHMLHQYLLVIKIYKEVQLGPTPYLPAMEWGSHPSNEKMEAPIHRYDQDLVTSWTRTSTFGSKSPTQQRPLILIMTFVDPVPQAGG